MDVEQLRYYSRWHDHVNRQVYEAPADPWAPIRVDPTALTTHNQAVRLNWGLGRVMGGDWDGDDNCASLDETAIYRGLVQRFDRGLAWDETALYERAAAQLEEHGQFRGYESLDEFRTTRCRYIDRLFESIRDEGYRPNGTAGHDPAAGNPFERAYVHHLEPLVTIGREGALHLAEGFHRVVIAQLVSVESIPVQVLCRHHEWQRVRDRVATGWDTGGPTAQTEARAHPDLADVRDGTPDF